MNYLNLKQMGMSIAKILKEKNSGKCGYFGIKDIFTEEKEDYMESFFLSENTKYLYMLANRQSSPLDYFVFNTEVDLYFIVVLTNVIILFKSK